jgi:cytochrome c-type biogenesis protein CcmH/NrfG
MVKKPAKTKVVTKKLSLKSEVLYLCSCCAVVVVALLATANMNSYIKTNNVLGAGSKIPDETPQMLINQKEYWNGFLNEHPTYVDGWIELTRINLEQGNYEKAKEAYQKALFISPNSPKVVPYKEVFK